MDNGSRNWKHAFLLALAGALFGILTSATNHGFGPFSQYTSKILGNDWAWVTACLSAAVTGTSWMNAFRRSLVLVLCAVCGYYLSDSLFGTYDSTVNGTVVYAIDGAISDVVAYLIIGTLASAAMSSLVMLMRKPHLLGLLARLTVPGYIAYGAFKAHTGMLQLNGPQDQEMLRVSQWILWVSVGAMALLIVAWVSRCGRPTGQKTTEASITASGSTPSTTGAVPEPAPQVPRT